MKLSLFFTSITLFTTISLFASELPTGKDEGVEQELLGPAMREAVDDGGQIEKPIQEPPAAPSKKTAREVEEGEDEHAPKTKKAHKKSEEDEGEDGGDKKKTKEKKDGKKEEDEKEVKIGDHIKFGGGIEVQPEYRSGEVDDPREHSEVRLDAAEIDFEIEFVEWATALLSLEWEPDDRRFQVKEAFITLGGTKKCPFFFRAGRLFVPFGIGTGALIGDTLSINDPLTIEIFETREEVLMVGKISGNYQIAAYVFNGDTHFRKRYDHIDQFGATIRYSKEEKRKQIALNFGLDFISNVFDSDNISEKDNAKFTKTALKQEYCPGIAAHMRYFWHGISFIAEVDTALTRNNFRDENGIELHLMPMAWMVEIGYIRQICKRKTFAAVDYSESYGLEGRFPKQKLMVTVGSWILHNVLLAIEYEYEVAYPKSQGGNGRSFNSVVGQIAYEW